MADIPAPLANRHTATGLLVAAPFGAVGALLLLVPGAATAVVAHLLLALAAAVSALALLLLWRALGSRSRFTLDTPIAVVGGLAVWAVVQAAETLVALVPALDGLRPALLFASGVAGVLVALGAFAFGVGVVLGRRWRGPSRFSLFAIAALTAVALVAVAESPTVAGPIALAVWSLSFLGLVPGLRLRREVANAGVPQGPAPA